MTYRKLGDREIYRKDKFFEVQGYIARGISFKDALRAAGTTKKTMLKGRTIANRYNLPTSLRKTPGRNDYELVHRTKKKTWSKTPYEPPTELDVIETLRSTSQEKKAHEGYMEGTDLLEDSYPKSVYQVDTWFDMQDIDYIDSEEELKNFIYQKFNSGFAPYVYSRYRLKLDLTPDYRTDRSLDDYD